MINMPDFMQGGHRLSPGTHTCRSCGRTSLQLTQTRELITQGMTRAEKEAYAVEEYEFDCEAEQKALSQ